MLSLIGGLIVGVNTVIILLPYFLVLGFGLWLVFALLVWLFGN